MKRRNLKGSITVFLSLLFTVILTLTCTVAESVRMYAAGVRAKSLTYMGVESEFAGYGRQVFDKYGVLLVYDEAGIESGIEKYITLNNFVSKDDFSGNVFDTIKLNLNKINLQKVNYVTDNGGDEYVNQILDFEKYEIVGNAAEELIDIFNSKENEEKSQKEILQQIETEDCDKLEEIDDGEITELVEKYEKSIDKIKTKKNIYSDFKVDVQNVLDQVDEENNILSDSVRKKLLKKFKNLEKKLNTLRKNVDKSLDLSEDYRDKKNKLIEEQNLDKTVNTADYIDLNKVALESMKGHMKSMMDDYIVPAISKMEEGTLVDKESATTTYIIPMDGKWSEIANDLEGLEQHKASEADEKNKGIYESAKTLIDTGILELVLTENMPVSSNSVAAEGLPSEHMKKGKENPLNNIANKALFVQYLDNRFGDYVKKENDSVLKYELEYILAGKQSDKENLSEVVTKLVVSRQVFNTASLMADKEKMATCDSMATSISIAFGLPFMQPLAKAILVEAWAFAESIADVRVLLQAGKVSLTKGKDEWNYSLENMLDVTKENSNSKNKNQKEGLDYQTYLKMLLLVEENKKIIYRSMDLIQSNISSNYNSSFRLDNAITSATVKVNYSVDRVFTALPFVSDTLDFEDEGYEFNVKASYSYITGR